MIINVEGKKVQSVWKNKFSVQNRPSFQNFSYLSPLVKILSFSDLKVQSVALQSKKKRKMSFPFAFCSLICIFAFETTAKSGYTSAMSKLAALGLHWLSLKIMKIMEATVRPRRTADNYWNIIRHLSPDAKLDLITMLTKSLKKTTSKRVSAKKYYGIWGDDGMSDDEFVKELKSLRSFNRESLMIWFVLRITQKIFFVFKAFA